MSDPGAVETAAVPRSVWGGTALLSVGRLVASGCTALILFFLARHLSGPEFGRLTFYLAALLLLESLTDFGTGTLVLRDGADDPRELARGIATARRLRRRLAALGALVLTLGALAFGEPGWPWLALASLYPLTRSSEVASLVYQREIAWTTPVLVRSATALLRLGLVAAVALAGARSAPPFLLAHAAGLAAGNLVLGALARRRLAAFEGPAPPLGKLFLAALPLGVASLSQQLYVYLDNGFLRVLRTEEELGHYNAAVRVMSLLLTVSVFATTTSLPWLARRHARGDLGEATGRLARPLILGAAILLGALWPWSEALLALLFGAPFADAGRAFRWLLVAALAIHANAGLLTAVVAASPARVVLGVTGLALATNALLNAWWVPAHGMEGAAAATLVTEGLVGLSAWSVLRRAGAAPRLGRATLLLAAGGFAASALLSSALA